MPESSQQTGPRCRVIIPAAGIGSRMQADRPKQYLQLAGKTVLEHTIDCFTDHDNISSLYIARAGDDGYWSALNLEQRLDIHVVEGGQERCHSVFNALLHLLPDAADDDWVLVHDAARPCLRKQDLDSLIAQLIDDPVGGLLAVPVRDTMKQADIHDRVEGTVDRNRLWHALTPQMFRAGDLFRAIKSALERNYLVTDEASAMEMAGYRPRLVEGHADNIKITRPEDLSLAAFFLQQQGRIR